MKNKLILMFGLPCSGKTEWYNKNKENFGEHTYINADKLKENYPDYDESVIGMYNEESIAEAKRLVYELIHFEISCIVMDAGGINKHYTESIINEAFVNYDIKMYFIDTPVEICIARNKERLRKVPESLIYGKEIKKLGCWFYYQTLGIECIRVPYFTREHLFFDMDGVLAPQLYLPRTNGEIDFVNSNYFENLPVLEYTSYKIHDLIFFHELDISKIYILSATPNSIVAEEKKLWLEKHYGFIPKENIFFVNQGMYKAEMFRDLAKYLKLKPETMCLVDDTMSIVEDVRVKYKMDSIHISHFLNDYLNN